MLRKKSPRTRLHERIADTLAAQMRSGSAGVLPTIPTLAEQFKVGKLTMWKAINLLRKKRLVESGSGKRTVIVGTRDQKTLPPSGHGASHALAQRIKDAIADGTYRVSDALPKTDYFVLSAHVSPNTLAAALRILESEELISRKGKKWVVGKTNVSLQRDYVSDLGPVVLALIPSRRFLFGAFGRFSHFTSFTEAFLAEMQRFGIRVQVVAMQQGEALPAASVKQDVHEIVTALGKRYRGTLVPSVQADLIPLVKEQAGVLQQFREPVIVFDNANQAEGEFAPAAQRGRVYRMFQDETRPAQLALSTLVNLGHSKIGTADYAGSTHGWSVERARTIQRLAAQRNPHVEIFTLHHQETFWDSDRYTYPEEFVKRHFQQSASLLSLLKQGVTALIAPNDIFARKYYALLTAAGVSIPKDISLVSFDNNNLSWLYPISTIDFGFANLGYRAAHIFLGDIPVRAGRNSGIQSEPVLLDRGSLAPPSKNRIVSTHTPGFK